MNQPRACGVELRLAMISSIAALRARSLRIGFGLGLLCALAGSMALGQEISPGTRTAPAIAAGSQGAQEVDAYIRANVEKLNGEDPDAQRTARDALVSPMLQSPAVTPLPPFMDYYAAAMNRELLPLARKGDLRTRINVGIITARVAERVNNWRLRETAVVLLDDKLEPIAYWGLKAAKPLMEPVMRNAGVIADTVPLWDRVIATVKRFGSGPVVNEGYAALSVPQNAPREVLALAIPAMQELLNWRVEQYRRGVPPEPIADNGAALFLSSGAIWRAQSQQEQLKTIQLFSDLIGYGAQQQQLLSDRDARDYLIRVLKYFASAVQVLPFSKTPALQQVLTDVQKLGMSMAPAQVAALCAQLGPALKNVPQFQAMELPKPILTGASGPADTRSTRPATLPE